MVRLLLTQIFLFAALPSILGEPTLSAKEKILIVRGKSSFFLEARKGIEQEMAGDYNLLDFVVTKKTNYEEFKEKVLSVKPKLMMLMDNRSVKFAIKFNKEDNPYAKQLKSVASMALNLKKILSNNSNICGIAYEMPALTLLVKFRYILENYKMKKVLTFYRSNHHQAIISDAKRQLKREGIDLIAVDTEKNGFDKDSVTQFIIDNLKNQIDEIKPDAIWIIIDNFMLNKKTYSDYWIKMARNSSIPLMCGIKKFVSSKSGLCTYAQAPDHFVLGNQMAQMGFSILEDGESPAEIGVEYVLSSHRVINKEKMDQLNIKVDKSKIKGIEILD